MKKQDRILLVDDVPFQINFAGNLLRSEGYCVSAATSGTKALQFLENHHPDLILLDIQMNDISGLKVCEILKKNAKTADIPVIFLTAETRPEIIQQGFLVGGCDYVKKPFVKEEYLSRIKTHLKISKQQYELKEANNELNQFCSAVSHDLKAPFHVINMLIQMLQDELSKSENAEIQNIVKMITSKSNQIIVMIERLLEFSKMCNIEPNIKRVNIKEIVMETYGDLKLIESDRKVEFDCEDLPYVMGDEILIQIAVKNLLSNSLKYTKKKKDAKIQVYHVEDQTYNIIKIKDNGAGFDMTYSDKLFQVFQRLHTEDEYEGSGVGLALVSRIMKRHNGFVQAWGQVNQGAEFSLFFPKN